MPMEALAQRKWCVTHLSSNPRQTLAAMELHLFSASTTLPLRQLTALFSLQRPSVQREDMLDVGGPTVDPH